MGTSSGRSEGYIVQQKMRKKLFQKQYILHYLYKHTLPYNTNKLLIATVKDNNIQPDSVSAGNTFQDLQRLRETANDTERYA
jgi:hypothetical protein